MATSAISISVISFILIFYKCKKVYYKCRLLNAFSIKELLFEICKANFCTIHEFLYLYHNERGCTKQFKYTAVNFYKSGYYVFALS
jgi:hypothetical protein